jgi:ABC-2 type transport system permease protein
MTPDSPRPGRFTALWQLTLARLREFYRIPEAVFWVYGFPLLMTVALGVAFRNKPAEKVTVDVQIGPGSAEVAAALRADKRFEVAENAPAEAQHRLKRSRTDLVIETTAASGASNGPGKGAPSSKVIYWFDPNRTESVAARNLADDVLVRSKAPSSVLPAEDKALEQTGSRYIDWLIPGLLGMNLMGGGLWGIGFVIVDLRVRKLLKRFLATPMRRSDFLLALMLSRLIFAVPEVLSLLLFAWLVFGVAIQGWLITLVVVIVLGGACFTGVGLFVASRAKTNEAVSGLMNLVMLPMWILSGVFFSSERFPEAMQPFIQALPLTALNNALRAVMLEGAGFAEIGNEMLIMVAWGGISFAVALRFFRWR